jgi:holo-[acyl-carrier protein] synthase
VIGLGIDLCEVKRFERLQENEAFLQRVFSPEEIVYCKKRAKSAQSFAARFAAKEAFGKALGIGISGGVTLKDVQVCHDPANKPYLQLSGETKKIAEEFGVTKIHLSLTHETGVAAAVVILE